MIALIQFLLLIFWVLDITNMPFMEMFDTTYPMNEVFWLLIWIFVLGFEVKTKKNDGGLRMSRLTHKRNNGIKEGYWSPNKKEELVQRLAEYEDTGLDPEQVQQLKERDTAKKPIIIGVNGAIGCRVGECPKCGGILRSYMRFCDECGQRLDWRE